MMPPSGKHNNSQQHQANQRKSVDATSNTPDSVKAKPKTPNERFLSLLSGATSNDEKPILRVNLIKKSNRPKNFELTLAQRRQERHSIKLRIKTPTTNHVEQGQALSPDQVLQTKSISDEVTKDSKQVSNEENINSDVCLPKPDEASKSRQLVVSLIKDIGHSSSKQDFEQMLKEIHSVINEIQEGQSDKPGSEASRLSHSVGVCSQQQQQPIERLATSAKAKPPSGRGNVTTVTPGLSAKKQLTTNKSIGDSQSKIKAASKSTPDVEQQQQLSQTDESSRRFLIDALLSSDDDTALSSDCKRESLNEYGSRLPERCLRVTPSHAKYISPHRKRSLEDRLNRAREAREKILEDRAKKFREILKKIDGMKAWKEEDTLNLKHYVDNKLQKAAEKRKEQLDRIVRKAHDEDSKVSEIQFINNLEAQNKRHDIISRKKEFEARLQDLQDERNRRFEEKQAKEAAAEVRRKSLEAERRAKVLEIQNRRKLKNQKVEQQKQVREKKRLEKNRDFEQKISAIKEAYTHSVQNLRNRIDMKQEQSERRHEINLKLIRQKAFELSIKRYKSYYHHTSLSSNSCSDLSDSKQSLVSNETSRLRLQLKPFTTKKYCTLCKQTIGSEAALFSHLRGETHQSSIDQFYGDRVLTTNETLEIRNLKHIVNTNEPLDNDDTISGDSQQQASSRSSSLVNYYHSSYLNQVNGGLVMSEADRVCLLAIEKKCRKLRHKLIVAGKKFNREWFSAKIRARLAQLIIQQRILRQQTTNTEATSLANTIDLSANNTNCQQNKPIYLKISRITRELISLTADQRISGGGLMPANIVHSADRLFADLNKQLANRKQPQFSESLLKLAFVSDRLTEASSKMRQCQSTSGPGAASSAVKSGPLPGVDAEDLKLADSLAMLNKMIEFHATDTLYLYDIISCFVSILRHTVPNVSLASRLPSTVASQSHSYYSTLIDPISLNSYHCHRTPVLPARIYMKLIGTLQTLCSNNSDLCYLLFQSNQLIYLSDILSYRLGFIIGNESPASSISGSSSAATLSVAVGPAAASTSDRGKQSASNKSTFRLQQNKQSQNEARLPKRRQEQQLAANKSRTSKSQAAGSETDGDEHDDDDDDDEDDETDNDNNDDDETKLWRESQAAETYKRTEEVVDDMTAGVCKLLAIITETILNRPLLMLARPDKLEFEQRSEHFISYMVSVGIVDTESVIMSHIHHQQRLAAASSAASSATAGATSAASGVTSASVSSAALASGATTFAGQQQNAAATLDQTFADSNSSQATSQFGASRKGQQHQHHQGQSSAVQQLALAGSLGGGQPSGAGGNASAVASSQNATTSKITNFTTSCIQFVTSLLKLATATLQAGNDELGDELGGPAGRAGQSPPEQQDKTQLLTTLKMSQFSGVLTLLYDMLVHSPGHFKAGLCSAPSQQPQPQPPLQTQLAGLLRLALSSLRLANYVAYIDLALFQATLASDDGEMLPLQFRHVCSQLISLLLLQQAGSAPFKPIDLAPNECELGDHAAMAGQDPAASELNHLRNSLLNELVLIMGNFAHLNPANQLWLSSGQRPTIVEQLVNLPFDYFSKNKLKLVLMPTLICFAYKSDQICQVIKQDLSLSMLTSFIKEQMLESQVGAANSPRPRPTGPQPSELGGAQKQPKTVGLLGHELLVGHKLANDRWTFERRFAKSKWLSASKYFEQQQQQQQ